MAVYLGELKRWDMRYESPNTRTLQGPIYTRAKMRVYAGLANHVVHASMKNAFH